MQIVELYGQILRVKRIFATEGRTILEGIVNEVYAYACRELLTRARVGMVICAPKGNANKTASGFYEDSTRLPEYYDGTYQYLKSLGIEEI